MKKLYPILQDIFIILLAFIPAGLGFWFLWWVFDSIFDILNKLVDKL